MVHGRRKLRRLGLVEDLRAARSSPASFVFPARRWRLGAARRWRGGHDSAAAETRCDDLIIALTSTRAGRAPYSHRRRAAADAAAPFYDVARPRGRRVEREPHAHAARRAPARRCVASTATPFRWRRRAGNARFLERFSPERRAYLDLKLRVAASRRVAFLSTTASGWTCRRDAVGERDTRTASARWRRGGRVETPRRCLGVDEGCFTPSPRRK